VVVAADECYLDYGWETTPTSIMAPAAAGDSPAGLLALHSLSKRSTMAGYRAGLVSGASDLIARLLHVRREIGLITPAPVQGAMIAALHDDLHVKQQRERYGRRRAALRQALTTADWTVDSSEAGLFLWVRHHNFGGRAASRRLAKDGILATPGDMYGDEGHRHVRISVTASDAQIAAACHRLEPSTPLAG
jgi:aspartate/methionine/tyrosine aminotransferase